MRNTLRAVPVTREFVEVSSGLKSTSGDSAMRLRVLDFALSLRVSLRQPVPWMTAPNPSARAPREGAAAGPCDPAKGTASRIDRAPKRD
jgi:hypothetical protein